ncbi:unnamed protein product [Rotaria sp. Silwood2]|nr:unnamed protein product [Rotaria sp. Silwood2]CAF2864670.1 unnamed protein product [Rotaria sp. Silwood2]CAF4170656.1 unnamed protein product [Rotaria sp. Silwood2]CAF4295174.1 unnamed protein product [Rotaria sp. Silwood2]
MCTIFDDLSDLSIIEIFSYLSCVDVLWSFSNLSTRLTTLLIEQNFYHHVNLSSTRYFQFQTFLSLLQLNEIQSLVIDCYASSLQLRIWPYLPNLRTLTVKGVRDFVDIFNFAQRHANTLTNLVVKSSDYFQTSGITKELSYPSWNVMEFVTEIFNHLPALRSLDLGMEPSFFLHRWPFQTIQTPLINLTITLVGTRDLLLIMSTKPLAHTLQQLHITMSDISDNLNHRPHNINLLPRMERLHTFTFVKSYDWHRAEEWTFLDSLTFSSIMPILRRINFSIVIDADDLIRMNRSALFTDIRHIDVHYAFMINDDRSHIELRKYLPFNNQSYSRPIASATFISGCWPDNQPFRTPGQSYSNKLKSRQHLFYTLPWIFNEFFPLCVPDRCISEIEVFTSSSPINKLHSSRLIKLNMSDNLPSSTTFFSQIMSPNKIVELHLLRCNRQVSANLPNLTNLILTDSLDSLNTCLFSRNIRSIQITLHHQSFRYTPVDWIALSTLSNLPLLSSLRILLYAMYISPDDTSCEHIAKTAIMVSDFSFCFRRRYYQGAYDINLVYTKHSLFIEQLRNRIVALSLNKEPYVVVDEDGCGLVIWF